MANIKLNQTGRRGPAGAFANATHNHTNAAGGGLLDLSTVDTTAWPSFTPIFTNFTKGSATITAKYRQVGKVVIFDLEIVLNGSTMGTAPTFTLPVTATTRSTNFPLGHGAILDSGTGSYNCWAAWNSTTTGKILLWDTNNNGGNITSTAPMTWGNSDTISINGRYEAA